MGVYFKNKYIIIKRYFDVVFSLFVLFMMFPLWLLIIAVLIIEEPTAPPLFKQIRIGKNGEKFMMYKFRTMVVGSEILRCNLEKSNEQNGPIFKMKNDPRITKVGKLLRKTSLDEFPQLLNIIKGEMSLIGPRPALECEVVKYSEQQRQRLKVKPGCTGLWQVSGRSNLCFDDMIQLDLKYIDCCGPIIDIKIFLKTFKAVLTGEGAY